MGFERRAKLEQRQASPVGDMPSNTKLAKLSVSACSPSIKTPRWCTENNDPACDLGARRVPVSRSELAGAVGHGSSMPSWWGSMIQRRIQVHALAEYNVHMSFGI